MPSKSSPDSLWSDVLTGRWVVRPWSSFRLLLIPIAIHLGWICLSTSRSPIAPLLFISYPVPSLTDGVTDSRYRKGLLDLLFVAYYIIFWSFVRQTITLYLCYPFARWWGIRKSGKLDRFGEQGYAMIYFAVFGAWGARIMNMQPTWWYNTSAFWLDYPHWRMTPELKCYYLMQAAYWCQQFVVLVLGLEKPRKDYRELVIHHVVTLWLVGWSYGLNLTLIGNAVYTSMDIPDTFLAISKLLNYLQLNRVKVLIFIVFMFIWTYFRHYLNFVILWSVYKEFDLIPEASRRWAPMDGVWMVWWMKWQIFVPLLLLQFLNIFWYYYFIVRIAYRALVEETIDDDRSDDEDEEEDEKKTN